MDVWKYSVILQWALIFIVSLTTLRIWWIFSKKYDYWKNRGIPCLKPLPFIGNLIFVMRKSAWDFFFELWKKYPRDYIGIFLAWKPVLVVQSPDLIKNILVKDADHFQDRFLYSGYSSDPLGSLNLFTVKVREIVLYWRLSCSSKWLKRKITELPFTKLRFVYFKSSYYSFFSQLQSGFSAQF